MTYSRALLCAATAIGGLGIALTGCGGKRADTEHASARPSAASASAVFRIPSDTEVRDSAVRASAQRGRMLLRHTRDSLPRYATADLACVSCHPRDGSQANAMPWVGVYARYPQYRSRTGAVTTIEDRINDCFRRSMNGRALPAESQAMRDIVAYMASLSIGFPVWRDVAGQGLPKMTPRAGSVGHGAAVYVEQCARCHGADGGGMGSVAPPLWGARSFNIGAGMARLRTAAAFVRYNMPADRPGTLTDQDAFDVAAYIVSRPRPDFIGKEQDWPHGDAPPDVAYPTRAARSPQR
jgi:thiosulfate dehydrogenase